MFSIIGDLFTLLFLQIFCSKEQKQDLSCALQHNNRQLRGIHNGYLAMGAQIQAISECGMKQVDEIFSQSFPDYTATVNRRRRAVGLPPI